MELDFSAFDYDMIILAYKIHRKNIANAPDVPAISVEFSAALASGSGDFLKVRYFSFSSAYFRKEKSLFCSCLCFESVGFYRVMNSWVPCFKKKKKIVL